MLFKVQAHLTKHMTNGRIMKKNNTSDFHHYNVISNLSIYILWNYQK
jgi:hypothetical protein